MVSIHNNKVLLCLVQKQYIVVQMECILQFGMMLFHISRRRRWLPSTWRECCYVLQWTRVGTIIICKFCGFIVYKWHDFNVMINLKIRPLLDCHQTKSPGIKLCWDLSYLETYGAMDHRLVMFLPFLPHILVIRVHRLMVKASPCDANLWGEYPTLTFEPRIDPYIDTNIRFVLYHFNVWRYFNQNLVSSKQERGKRQKAQFMS